MFLLLLACHDPKAPPPESAPVESVPPSESAPSESAPPDSAPLDSGPADGPQVLISEIQSKNDGTLTDGDGDTPDWVELYNASGQTVDLLGWTLSDDDTTWTFPSLTLLPGEFTVIYASGKGTAGPTGEVHSTFQITSDGETLTLARPDGGLSHTLTVPALTENQSYGLSEPTTTTVAVGEGSPARISDAPAEGWTLADFDDSAWTAVTLGVGFDRSAADAAPVNAALDADATESSDYPGFTALYGVDGEPGTISHTNTADLAPWWQVDLGADYSVSEIRLVNRADCCAERLYNITVRALDASGAEVWASDVQNPVAEGSTPTSPGSSLTVTPDAPVTARAVRIDKTAVGGVYSSEWLSLAEVAVTGSLAAPYADALGTDLGEGWTAATLAVRAPLTVTAVPDRAVLTMAWDDGFQALLNGAEIAQENLGDTQATAAHDGETTATYAVDPTLLVAGANTLAILGQNVAADDDDLLILPTLRLDSITVGDPAYFATPTPGEPNGEGYAGVLDPPTFSDPRGFYDDPFTLTLSSPVPGVTIVYTQDGSVPTLEHGTLVTSEADATPSVDLAIETTALVRAAAFKDGYGSSAVATHTYLYLADVIRQPAAPDGLPTIWDGLSEAPVDADYEMDPEIVDDPTYSDDLLTGLRAIPTLSLVTDPDGLWGADDGLYIHSAERGEAWERAVSVELILPDGSTGFQQDCGARVHGYGWRYHSSTKKHSFRLEFRKEYGKSKLEYPLFADAPIDEFDSVVLRAGGSKTWLDFRDPANAQYLHDSFARDTARDMGKIDGHATYVHLYLNGLYWGLYNPVERPEADFGAAYFGGSADEYDAINRRTSTNEAIDGDLDAYNTLLSLADADLTDPANYAAVEDMLDLDALIDYMLIHQYTVNRDGPCCFESNNMRGVRRREDGETFHFFVWDMEYSLWEATDDTNVDVDVAGSISHVYAQLRETPEFRARYAERAAMHLTGTGALTPDAAAARYQDRADEIYDALVAESARWGDTYRAVPYTRDVEWTAEYDRLMDGYFPERTELLIEQLTAAGLYDE